MRRAFLLVVVLAVAASTAGAATQRTEHDCVRGGELWFYAADGTKLVGHRFGKGTTAVILAHQSEGDLCDWLPYARRLASRGYFVFPVDFRGYGFSQARTGAAANPVRRRPRRGDEGAPEARQEEGLPRRRLDGRDRVARRRRERDAAGRRRRQHLGAGALPRHGRASRRRRGCACPCSTSPPRLTTTRATTSRRTPRRCTRRPRAADKRLEVLPGSLHGIGADGRLGAREGGSSRLPQRALSPRRQLALPPGSALLTADGEVAASSRSAARRRVRAMRLRAGLDPASR